MSKMMTKAKQAELWELVHNFQYQAHQGISTWSTCSREGCTESARGGRVCRRCLIGQLEGTEYARLITLLGNDLKARKDLVDQDGEDPTNAEGPELRKAVRASRAAIEDFINHI